MFRWQGIMEEGDLLPVGPGDPEDPSICKLTILFSHRQSVSILMSLLPLENRENTKRKSTNYGKTYNQNGSPTNPSP